MKNNIIVIKYILAYLFIGLAIGSYFPILTFYLEEELHLSGTQIGIISAFTTFIPIIFLPLWGIITDLVKSPKKTLLISLLFSSLMIFILSYITDFYLFFVIILLFNLFRVPIFSLFDEILISVSNERNINFGMFRAGCSFGVSTSSFIGFYLARGLGSYQIFLILSAIFYLIAFLIIVQARNVEHKEGDKVNLKKDLPILLSNRTLLLICIIWAITYGVLDSNFSYMSNYLNVFTNTDKYISVAIFLSVFIEVFVLTFGKRLYYKASLKTIIFTVNILSILRYILIFIFPNAVTILTLAPLHGITFGLSYPLVIQYIKNNVSKKVLSTAYTLYNALVALLTALFSYYTGVIKDVYLPNIFLLFIGLLTVNVLLIVVLLRKNRKKLDLC